MMILNNMGKMIEKWWLKIPRRFENVAALDTHQIMPNHLHGIIVINDANDRQSVGVGFPDPSDPNNGLPDRLNGRGNRIKYGRGNRIKCGRGNRAPTLGQIVAYFKYQSTKQINILQRTPGKRLWQRNYYEHVIRNETDLNQIREYIINNPQIWDGDQNNPKNLKISQ